MPIKLNDLLDTTRLNSLYRQNTSMALIGSPGTGKSSVVRQIPQLLSELYKEEFGYIEQLAPSIDAQDVRGFMIPTKDEQGRAVARYTYPAILPSREYLEKHPRGVMFVDEFLQSDQLTQKACAALILEKMVGEYQLPAGWWVITASNRMSDRSGVTKPLMHIINRQRTIEIEPSVDGWALWARDAGVHPFGVAFARSHPGVVFSTEVPSDPRPFCTPRSFVSAMNLMKDMVGDSMNLPSDVVTQELVAGDIGDGAAAAFFGYIKVADQLPTIEEIKSNPLGAKCPPSDRLDAAFAAQQMCVYHADGDNIDALWTYTERLPRELQVTTAKQLLDKAKGALLNSKKFGSWLSENSALIVNTTSA